MKIKRIQMQLKVVRLYPIADACKLSNTLETSTLSGSCRAGMLDIRSPAGKSLMLRPKRDILRVVSKYAQPPWCTTQEITACCLQTKMTSQEICLTCIVSLREVQIIEAEDVVGDIIVM